jgi:hypothetical protein
MTTPSHSGAVGDQGGTMILNTYSHEQLAASHRRDLLRATR